MTERTDSFDPYEAWLQIPREDQPPSYYRLLGVKEFEQDEAIIDAAAKRRTAYLHPMSSGPNRESVQRLLNEVAKARRTLLSADAKASYDSRLAALANKEGEQQAVGEGSVESNTPVIRVATRDATVPRERRNVSAESNAMPARGAGRRSRVNDRRLQVVAIIALLLVAIVGVLYANGRREDLAGRETEFEAEANSTATSDRSTTKRGEKRNAISLVEKFESSLPGAPVKKPKEPKPSRKEKRNASNRKSTDVKLGEGWRDSVPVVAQVFGTLTDVYEIRGEELITAKDQRLFLQSKKGNPRNGTIIAKGVTLGPGDWVSVDTNMRKALPDRMKVGLAVGPIRLRLESMRNNLQVRVNNQTLGTIPAARDAVITLALLRDTSEKNMFRWIVTDGAKAIGGRAKLSQDVADRLQVGLLYFCSKRDLQDPIWLKGLRVGTSSRHFEFGETIVVSVKSNEQN